MNLKIVETNTQRDYAFWIVETETFKYCCRDQDVFESLDNHCSAVRQDVAMEKIKITWPGWKQVHTRCI